ncbi:hypothetical protein PTTG_01975 [Puccinia triticina 1-1 BBBD Race 1]|uniref:NAD(P)-binding protein n=2 Tax=Puccinia triticina TaxID=208348 RepID=A0A180G787_PUCT1|nr:uncharacterized protein PtA15_7A535 [Puccinia triticina]OAV88349.1 hypothetical protein PTTG_01975 [Puccinia triticina 1-1 BBBD Race 1]WAQ86806.1 hypothetical protein PtA15_7A535 [Puccinia triticina]WAR56671.1 hypothetical protein PtB15_7B521 [Puccinia triticina]
MRTNTREDLPRASHPASLSTMSVNSLIPSEFPFKNFSSWPQFSYALENLAISIATIISALADCILTLYLWIPLGLTRSLIQNVLEPLLWFLTSQPNPGPEAQIIVPRVVVISGASSGIGASLVKRYAGPDSILVLLARNPARLNQVAKMARTAGCKAVETHSIDYAHDDAEKSIKQVIQAAHQKYGSIDLAISNAGTATFTDDNPHGPEPWGEKAAQRITKINVSSTYAFIMCAWELMKKQRSGNICIISSIVAFAGPPEFAAYAATKANLMAFSQSLRALSTPYGIRVSCICPGFIESGMSGDLLAAGSSVPGFLLADSDDMAQRIKQAVDGEQAGVVWPISHGLPLIMASRLNWLNGDLSRWVMSKMGVAGQMVS